ncbi:hypothetical protein CCAND38_870004 [Capnocytophaga canis]|uniref:Uncharacterized protein n=1 Tax=Capnocytophaga canis TaxID=1848903 RepID=A0A0B7ICZ1_9FLAO|nr:hypothetical protein CCAND38_870004 [Capnocytophaga canis]
MPVRIKIVNQVLKVDFLSFSNNEISKSGTRKRYKTSKNS